MTSKITMSDKYSEDGVYESVHMVRDCDGRHDEATGTLAVSTDEHGHKSLDFTPDDMPIRG